MTTKIRGELEIDHERGVIYFHSDEGYTVLRVCSLPRPIPVPKSGDGLDVTHMHSASWRDRLAKHPDRCECMSCTRIGL